MVQGIYKKGKNSKITQKDINKHEGHYDVSMGYTYGLCGYIGTYNAKLMPKGYWKIVIAFGAEYKMPKELLGYTDCLKGYWDIQST